MLENYCIPNWLLNVEILLAINFMNGIEIVMFLEITVFWMLDNRLKSVPLSYSRGGMGRKALFVIFLNNTLPLWKVEIIIAKP
jgi:hypothetical protein